jgi:hypothetical protein
MLNYVDHRAMFEGMNAHLWAPNSGRMLWMTQPAWPSNYWQILSHDYDTQASYYGVKKACEPVHVQLDLSNYSVTVVNTTTNSLKGLTVAANVYSLDNKLLLHNERPFDSPADSSTNGSKLDLAPLFSNGVLLVKLELKDVVGKLLSDNFYWLAADSASYRQLNKLPAASVVATIALGEVFGKGASLFVRLENQGKSPALEIKLTLVDPATGARILPAYYSDNYISLLAGESRSISVGYTYAPGQAARLAIRGWNVPSEALTVPPRK